MLAKIIFFFSFRKRGEEIYVTARLGHPAGQARNKGYLVNASKDDDDFSMTLRCSQCGRSRSIQSPPAGSSVGFLCGLCVQRPPDQCLLCASVRAALLRAA